MTTQDGAHSRWGKIPISLRAIVSGLLIALVAANIWPVLLFRVQRVLFAALAEIIFLCVYLWWASGGGPPRAMQAARAAAFRRGKLSPELWLWGVLAALLFAITVHSSIVLLFRFTPFPAAEFRRGYDLSFVRSLPLKWVVVVVSAISAGVCEETGFRGYMQRPIERRHGATVAILISSLFFTVVHLSKSWAIVGMAPIVLGAGILLGLLAWSSGSLIPGMIGHAAMDTGLFAYWWTDTAGTFSEQPISSTGVDSAFLIACGVFVVSLTGALLTISKLRRLRSASHERVVQSPSGQ
jgi:membrane protease YdiL (CAAX protease family)